VSGRVLRLEALHSPQLHNERDVYVHLPRGYDGRRRFPVVYMQDGQNLFDDATSFCGEWHVDEAMESAPREAQCIVVGVANTGPRRLDEYTPFFDRQHGGGDGELYLDFLLDTLKPLIDRSFLTLPSREQTGIAGSSLGGLISLYGFFARPHAFGWVAALSPSVWFARRALLPFVASAPLNQGRIYLDTGTEEGRRTLWNARRLRTALVRRGYVPGVDLAYVEDAGAGHEEAAWGQRFPGALRFLLGAHGLGEAAA